MPAEPTTRPVMGRPVTGSRKVNASFYPAELAALDKLVAEQGIPRASLVAQLTVQQLVIEGLLVIDDAGNAGLPAV